MSVKKFEYHGSFTDRERAEKKATESGGFIRERMIDGKLRHFVLSIKKETEKK